MPQFDPSAPYSVIDAEIERLTTPPTAPVVEVPEAPVFDAAQPFEAVPEPAALIVGAPTFDPKGEFQKSFTPGEVKAMSVEELDEQGDFNPVAFGFENESALDSDPLLKQRVLDVYKRREIPFRATTDQLKNIVGSPGAAAGKTGSAVGTAVKSIAVGVGKVFQGVSESGVGGAFRLLGAASVGGKAGQLGVAEEGKKIQRGQAEIAAGAEMAAVGTADLVRRGVRTAIDAAASLDPSYDPATELSNEEWATRLSNDVAGKKALAEANRGAGEMVRAIGLHADTLKEAGIEVRPEVIAAMSPALDITNLLPLGAGAKVGVMTKSAGRYAVREVATAATKTQADGFIKAVNAGAESLGKATKGVGVGVEKAGDIVNGIALRFKGAATIVGGVTAGTGNIAGGAGIILASKLGGVTAVKVGRGIQAASKYVPGAARAGADIGTEFVKGYGQGLLFTAPFMIGADAEEREALLGAAGLGGVARGGIRAIGHGQAGVRFAAEAAQDKLGESIFKEVNQSTPPETKPYGTDPRLDAESAAQIVKLDADPIRARQARVDAMLKAFDRETNQREAEGRMSPRQFEQRARERAERIAKIPEVVKVQQNLIGWAKNLFKDSGVEFYAVDDAGMMRQTGGQSGRGFTVRTGQTIAPDGTVKPLVRVFMNGDVESLPHEMLHALGEIDAPGYAEFRNEVNTTLTPDQKASFEQIYNAVHNGGLPEAQWKRRLSPEQVSNEIAAELFSRTVLGEDLSGVAPSLKKRAALFTAGLLEKLGVPLGKLTRAQAKDFAPKGTKIKTGFSTLGLRPGTEAQALGQNFIRGLLKRAAEDKLTVAPEPSLLKGAKPTDITSPNAITRRPPPAGPAAPTSPGGTPPAPAPAPATPGATTPGVPPATTPSGPPNIRVTPEAQSRFSPIEGTPGPIAELAYKRHAEDLKIDEAKVAAAATGRPEIVARVDELSNAIGADKPALELEYQSVKSDGSPGDPAPRNPRLKEREAAYLEEALGAIPEKTRKLVQKVIVPVRWVSRGSKMNLIAMSLDKVIANVQTIVKDSLGKAKAESLIPYDYKNGALTESGWLEVVKDIQDYSENQANGYRGDGLPLTIPDIELGLSVPRPTPGFEPIRIEDKRKADFLNLVQGIKLPFTTKEGQRGVPANLAAQKLAEVNFRKVEPPVKAAIRSQDILKQTYKTEITEPLFPGRGPIDIAEPNPLRNQFRDAGVDTTKLHPVTEEISPENVAKVTPRPDLNYKAPVTDIIRGGFLPKLTELSAEATARLEPFRKAAEAEEKNTPETRTARIQWAQKYQQEYKKHRALLGTPKPPTAPPGQLLPGGGPGKNALEQLGRKILNDPADNFYKFVQDAGGGKGLEPGFFEFEEARRQWISKAADTLGKSVKGGDIEILRKFADEANKGYGEVNLSPDFDPTLAFHKKQFFTEALKAATGSSETTRGDFLPGATMFLKRQTVENIGNDILKADAEQWQKITNEVGGLTNGAYRLGASLTKVEDVAKLRAFEAQAKQAYDAAKSVMDFDTMMREATKKQFFTEALETATGSSPGKKDLIARMIGADWKPPFPEEAGGQLLPKVDNPQAVQSAAIRNSETGEIFGGSTHGEAMRNASVAEGIPKGEFSLSVAYANPNYEQGFVTQGGDFLTRSEARQRVEEIGQIPPEKLSSSTQFNNDKNLESVGFQAYRNFLPGEQADAALRHGFLPDSKTPKRETDEGLANIAAKVATAAGVDYNPSRVYAPLNTALGNKLADFYDKAKSDPKNPEVISSYAALADDTMKQYRALAAAGYVIEPFTGEGEPYKNSAEAVADIRDNKHLFVLSTALNFSGENDNPMLLSSGVEGLPTVNDVFRGVHDVFGHAKEGYQFGPRGEFNAWRAHSEMYSPEAQGALAAETLAQNSWVNFGPHLRLSSGKVPMPMEPGFTPLTERPFAEQKAVVVPQDLIDEALKQSQVEVKPPIEPSPNSRAEVERRNRWAQADRDWQEGQLLPGNRPGYIRQDVFDNLDPSDQQVVAARGITSLFWLSKSGELIPAPRGHEAWADEFLSEQHPGIYKKLGAGDDVLTEIYDAMDSVGFARGVRDGNQLELSGQRGTLSRSALKSVEALAQDKGYSVFHHGKRIVDRVTPLEGQLLPKTEAGKKVIEDNPDWELSEIGRAGEVVIELRSPSGLVGSINAFGIGENRGYAQAGEIYVDKGFRRQGIGEMLFRELATELQAHGVSRMEGRYINQVSFNLAKKLFGKFDFLGDAVEEFSVSEARKRLPKTPQDEGTPLEVTGVSRIDPDVQFLPKKKKQTADERVAATDYSKYDTAPSKKRASKSTGWILPNKAFVPLDVAFHENYLAENADELNTRFGSNFGKKPDVEDRLAALNKGFVRIRGGLQGEKRTSGPGGVVVELNERYFLKHRPALENYLLDRVDSIDNLTVNLLNDKGNVKDYARATVHELEGAERANALLGVLDDLRLRGPEGQLLPGGEETLPGLNLPSEERAKQLRVKSRVAKSRDKFPEALKLAYAKDDAGQFVLGDDGKPKPRVEEYRFMETPLAREAAKGLKGEDRVKAVAEALGKRLAIDGADALKNPELSAGTKWYSTARTRLKGLFGDDSKFFAELLGATSARTPVEVNYRFALDAYNQFKQGKFDGIIKKYREGKLRWLNADVKDFLKANPGNTDPSRGQFLDWWVIEHDLGPTQVNGKKYGANSRQVLRVLDGSWSSETTGPKTPNFAGNLSGSTFAATVDVWAARALHRLANEGNEKPWRILPEMETGVTDEDFAIGQAAYKYAADKLGMKPDALQAVLWFAEKAKWEREGWTRGAGALKSDFNVLLKETEKVPGGLFRMKNPQKELAFPIRLGEIRKR